MVGKPNVKSEELLDEERMESMADEGGRSGAEIETQSFPSLSKPSHVVLSALIVSGAALIVYFRVRSLFQRRKMNAWASQLEDKFKLAA